MDIKIYIFSFISNFTFLDTHFVLVDNAQIKFGGEVDFRAELERELSKNKSEVDHRTDPKRMISAKKSIQNSNNESNDIPLVVLVLGGGNLCL